MSGFEIGLLSSIALLMAVGAHFLWKQLFSPGKKDRFRISPTLSGVGFFAIYLFFAGIPGLVSFILLFCFILFLAGFVLLWVAFIGKCIWRRYWRTMLSVLVAPLVMFGLRDPVLYVNECLHLLLEQRQYEREIAALPKSATGKFEIFDWSVGFAGNNTFLIYDETGEIALPMNKHSSRAGDENGSGPDCAGKVTHLYGHYYVCNF